MDIKMTPDESRVILITKLKGPKNKGISLLKIAQAVKILKDLGKSSAELGKDFDVSRPTIDDFYNMNKHPSAIKKMIHRNEIGQDTSTKLFTIKDIKTRIAFAKELAGMSSLDSRYIIDYHKRAPLLLPRQCKKVVMDSKTNVREIHLLVTPLEDDVFKKLNNLATKMNISIEQASKKAIIAFLENNES